MTQEDIIRQAIENRHRLIFKHKGIARLVEPFVLGAEANGQLLLKCWQLCGGGTGWRVFAIESIIDVQETCLAFDGNRRSRPDSPETIITIQTSVKLCDSYEKN